GAQAAGHGLRPAARSQARALPRDAGSGRCEPVSPDAWSGTGAGGRNAGDRRHRGLAQEPGLGDRAFGRGPGARRLVRNAGAAIRGLSDDANLNSLVTLSMPQSAIVTE